MLVITLKFLEVGTRAIFIVLSLYLLEIEQAGQFGLIITLQGFASFAFGYERQIDLLRRNVGQSPAAFDQAVSRAVSLFGANYTILIPLFVASLIFVADVPPELIILCILIAIVEQLMSFAYHLAIVDPRYRPMLVISIIKNTLTTGLVCLAISRKGLDLTYVLGSWAFASSFGLALVLYSWLAFRQKSPDTEKLYNA